MKKCIVLFLILIVKFTLISQDSFFNEFEIRRVSANFNGSAYNGSSILVYGEAGVILRSTNLGKDWEQIQINDSLNIIDVINIGTNYYGIASNKYIISSSNDGLNWFIKDFADSVQFFKILNHSNKLYVILNKKIWILNKNLELIKEYSYCTDSSYFDAEIVGNKLIFSAGKGLLGIIDLQYNTYDTIYLNKYGVCQDCPVPIKLTSNRTNLLYFLVGSNFYQIDFDKDSANFIFKPIKISNIDFFAFDNNIYYIYSTKLPYSLTDSIYFFKADKNTHKNMQINRSKVDRYILNTYFKDLKFITKDILIAVGKKKLIFMSFNGGKDWELKSLFSGNNLQGIYVIDKLNAKIIENNLRITFTSNGGITWLPSSSFHSIMQDDLSYPDIKYFKDKNNGLFINSDYQIIDKNTAYTTNGGENLLFKDLDNIQNFQSEFRSLITKSNDDYLVVTHRYIDSIAYIIFDFIDKNIDIIKHTWTTDMGFYYIENINDTIFAIGKNPKDEEKNRYFLYYSPDFTSTWYEYLYFYIDTLQTYRNNKPLNNNPFNYSYRINNYIFSICYYQTHNGDSSCYKVYLTDLDKKYTKEVITLNNSFFPTIFFINNKYYLLNSHLVNKELISEIYSTDNIDLQPINWNIERLQRYTEVGIYPTMIVNDSAFMFSAYDSVLETEYFFLAFPKIETSVFEEQAIEEINSIFITTPVPFPANSYSKMEIFFDQRLNIDNADFSAINLLGLQVSGKEDFQFTKINSYSGELIWRPQAVSPGVYIITVRIGTNSCSKVIIKS